LPALNEERREINEAFDWIAGVNVYVFRMRRGMTQKDLAHHANMDQTVLNRVEIGQRSLRFREAVCIAKALGLRVETLTRLHTDIDYEQ
jgi:transcriptional regulator with XRE-family HTH domain